VTRAAPAGDGDPDDPGGRRDGGLRGPGRPRDVRADAAIAAAVAELLAEVGYGALTIEGVAARAGVAKTTIYRRFAGVEPDDTTIGDLKARMVAGALAVRARSTLAAADTGSLRGDLLAHLGAISHALGSPIGQAIAGLVVGAGRTPELAAGLRHGFVAARRAEVAELLARAAARGELRDGLDHELVIDLLVGPLWYRALVWGEAPGPERLGSLVDALLPVLEGPAAPGT
jgi:AcrR family transcriptional regulator